MFSPRFHLEYFQIYRKGKCYNKLILLYFDGKLYALFVFWLHLSELPHGTNLDTLLQNLPWNTSDFLQMQISVHLKRGIFIDLAYYVEHLIFNFSPNSHISYIFVAVWCQGSNLEPST